VQCVRINLLLLKYSDEKGRINVYYYLQCAFLVALINRRIIINSSMCVFVYLLLLLSTAYIPAFCDGPQLSAAQLRAW
jgi:hypothetical protein